MTMTTKLLIFDADAEDAAEAARLAMQNSSGQDEAVDGAESEAPHSIRGMSETDGDYRGAYFCR